MNKEFLLQRKFPKQDAIIRILGLLFGCGMIILGVFNFISYKVVQPIDVVLAVYYL